MTLNKRDCGIYITLTPSGTQYLGIDIDIKGDHYHILASSAVGSQFGDFVSALYSVFTEGYDCHNECGRSSSLTDESHRIHTFVATAEWDEEGEIVECVMSRKATVDIDLEQDMMNVEFRWEWKLVKTYTVRSQDFCYAVAKACTEALKCYGFYGYRHSTEYDYFKIYQLLYIKAFALRAWEVRELSDTDSEWVKRTSFEKEMELLLFDM